MTGFYLFQEPRATIIETLQPHIVKIINDYKARSTARKWPTQVIVYRQGVSDGDMLRVTAIEKAAFKAAIAEVSKANRDFRAGLTMLVAQKNNTRLYPITTAQESDSAKAYEVNVKPGTCVFNDIVSPVHEQYVLVAQRALMVRRVFAANTSHKTRLVSGNLASGYVHDRR